jgi:hypothetical protein
MVRRMSISLRAPTVVVKLPLVAVQFGGGADLDLEVAGGQLHLCRRSCGSARWPAPAGCGGVRRCRHRLQADSTLSWVAFKTIMSPLVFGNSVVVDKGRAASVDNCIFA